MKFEYDTNPFKRPMNMLQKQWYRLLIARRVGYAPENSTSNANQEQTYDLWSDFEQKEVESAKQILDHRCSAELIGLTNAYSFLIIGVLIGLCSMGVHELLSAAPVIFTVTCASAIQQLLFFDFLMLCFISFALFMLASECSQQVCQRRYKDAFRRYNAQFRKEIQQHEIMQPTAIDAMRVHRTFSITTLWPPLHSKREVNLTLEQLENILNVKERRRLEEILKRETKR